jgi:replication factor C subunit 1
LKRDNFDVDNDIVVPECMTGLTFVFTGNMDELNRDDAIDIIKTLGGRVTTAVSGKTNYLVVGPVLEDGRDYTEGSKYRKATSDGDDSKVKLIMGEKYLYGLCHMYHDKAMKEKGIDINDIIEEKKKKEKTAAAVKAAAAATTTTTGSTVSNPYAKKGPVSNPYAKAKGPVVTNPYAKNKGPVSNPYAHKSSTGNSSSAAAPMLVSQNDTINSLWVDRYKPSHTREILGNKTNVKKLQDWLRTWEKVFNNSKNANKTFSNPRGGPWKAALLSGPPGIGSKYSIDCFHLALF